MVLTARGRSTPLDGGFAFESLGVRGLKKVRSAVEVHRLDGGNMPGGQTVL